MFTENDKNNKNYGPSSFVAHTWPLKWENKTFYWTQWYIDHFAVEAKPILWLPFPFFRVPYEKKFDTFIPLEPLPQIPKWVLSPCFMLSYLYENIKYLLFSPMEELIDTQHVGTFRIPADRWGSLFGGFLARHLEGRVCAVLQLGFSRFNRCDWQTDYQMPCGVLGMHYGGKKTGPLISKT